MSIRLPTTKSDTELAEQLSTVPVEELSQHIPELLEWLQDWNWPVSRPIAAALSRCGAELVEPVRTVLQSNDDIWKLWVLSGSLPNVNVVVRDALREEILRIARRPTAGEQ